MVAPAATSDADTSQDAKAAGFVQDHSVKLAGVGQWVGDTALVAYGFATKNKKIGSVGALGYAAGFVGLRYGNPKVEKQLALVERQLGDYFRQQGIEIPKDPTLENLRKPGGVIDGIESFLYAYPTQIINTCFTLMGVQLFRDGLQHKIKPLMVSGPMLATGGLIGLLLKAKKPDPEHPPQGTWEKAKSWVQENPLRATGILAMASPIALAMNGIDERKSGKNSYLFKLLAAAGFGLCNTMIAISSKSEGGGAEMDDKTRDAFADVASRVIAAQPKETQQALVEQVAGYMASQPYVHMTADDISVKMHQKLAEASKGVSAGRAV